MIVVDNGGSDAEVVAAEGRERVRLLEPRENLGFAGGCNFGAAEATSDVLVFLNPDTVVGPGALRQLARTLEDPAVGIAMARLCLLDRPELLNSGWHRRSRERARVGGAVRRAGREHPLARGRGRRERGGAGDPAGDVSRPRRVYGRALHVPGGRRAELARPPGRATRRRRPRAPTSSTSTSSGGTRRRSRCSNATGSSSCSRRTRCGCCSCWRRCSCSSSWRCCCCRRSGAGSEASSGAGGGACATCAGSSATGARRGACDVCATGKLAQFPHPAARPEDGAPAPWHRLPEPSAGALLVTGQEGSVRIGR